LPALSEISGPKKSCYLRDDSPFINDPKMLPSEVLRPGLHRIRLVFFLGLPRTHNIFPTDIAYQEDTSESEEG
jgi:hypothetical protein